MSTFVPEGYDFQRCGLCEGTGKSTLEADTSCQPCKGTGKVLVHKPPIKCVRCEGIGKFIPRDKKGDKNFILCVVCHGSGWLMTLIK
jgi:DnaJ-class molecular chaperone